MDKIAVISDIHSNLEALYTTLEDIKKRDIKRIFCLGDIISKGVNSNECVDLIRKNCEVVLQGNCDKHFTNDHDFDKISQFEKERILWNRDKLSKENKDYIRGLEFSYELYISGSLVRFFHASPTSDYKTVVNLDTIHDKYSLFLPSKHTGSDKIADIVVYGHIHHQYMDKLYNKTLINVGSVGNSFDAIRNPIKDSSILETTNSHYLIIKGEVNEKEYGGGISFEFVRIPYDVDKELEKEDENIEKEQYRLEIKSGIYRNMEKVMLGFKEKGIDLDKI